MNVCVTRWMSVYRVTERFLLQWDELKEYFREVATAENSYMAEILLKMYKDDTTLDIY